MHSLRPEFGLQWVGSAILRLPSRAEDRTREMMAEAVTPTTALIAVGAAAAAVARVLLIGLLRARRRGGGGQQQVLALVSEMNTRMEVMVRELSEALERAQEEGRRNRFLGELGASIHLGDVLAPT